MLLERMLEIRGPKNYRHIAGNISRHIGEALHGNTALGAGPMVGVSTRDVVKTTSEITHLRMAYTTPFIVIWGWFILVFPTLKSMDDVVHVHT